MASIFDSMAVLMNGIFGRQIFFCVKEKSLILNLPGCQVITAHSTKCFPYESSLGQTNCKNIPQAPALQLQATLTLLFQNLKFHNELFDARKSSSLTHSIISGPLGDLMLGSKEKKGPHRCDPSAVIGRDRTTQMKKCRLDLDFGPILAVVSDVSIFQIPAGNPEFCIIFPVSWEATGSHTTTVPS